MRGRRVLGRAARSVRNWLGAERPLILMYHRVADLANDPWSLAVSPDRFATHLEILRANRSVVPLSWLVTRLEQGRSARHSVAITFDDAYIDVLDVAKSLLDCHDCPATVFVPPDFVGSSSGFWWDTLTRIFLATPDLPERLELTTSASTETWSVGAQAILGETARSAVHFEVWSVLKAATKLERARHLARVIEWAGVAADAPASDRCLTEDQVRALSRPGFIDIGGHTMSHPSLPMLSIDEQQSEIGRSLAWIADKLGLDPVGLAYPYGDHDAISIEAARRAGARFACTTGPSAIRRGARLFALPRLQVCNLDAGGFSQLISDNG